MKFRYRTRGVCSREIRLETDGHTVSHVEIVGGCNGNSQGVAALVEGMEVDEVIRRTQGIRCGGKDTSCPDQLAKALSAAMEKLARQKAAASEEP